jgi:hypothetical protein
MRVLIACLTLAGGTLGAEERIQGMRLIPGEATLTGKGSSQQFAVMAKMSDGSESDVTARAVFVVKNSSVATVRQTGRLFAMGDGQTAFEAQVDGYRATASVRVEKSAESKPFSFSRDIGEIFTRRGCNGSRCHGGVKGQAGFKLSDNGIHPKEDYRWIVQGGTFQVLSPESKGPAVPRIDKANPAESALLKKAVMEVPHGGGRRFTKDSDDYRAILEWIRAGAPFGEAAMGEAARVVKLETFPKDVVLPPGRKQRILVAAHYSDGRTEDFTHRVLYTSNDSEIARVSSSGEVVTEKPGETAILIKVAGRNARVGIGVAGSPLANYPKVTAKNFIDEDVFAKLRRFNIVPSELGGDAEFLRRVCLDIAGRLPTPERVEQFVASRNPKKRAEVIDALLESPEYVDYWTFRLSDLFRVSIFPVGINPKWTQEYYEWIRDAVERDRPYSELASERIAAQGYSAASRHYLPYLVIPPAENMMGEQVRVFMGRRLDCAQCHDHPYEEWTQDQFWGLTAFFGPMFKLGGNPESVIFDFPEGKEVAPDVPSPTPLGVFHPRTKARVQPALLDGKTYPFDKTEFPRRELAAWMTSHPYFAEAAANRIWSNFFGRGIVNPVDDFRSTNPPSHPELLSSLAAEFQRGGYRFKNLIRLIANSRTYQLAGAATPSNAADRINYSHALPRPLDAEVLLDAINDVTGVRERFAVGTNRGEWRGGKTPLGTRAVELKEADIYATTFFDAYGRPNRYSVPERDMSPKLAQALHMLAGNTYTEKLAGKGSRAQGLLDRQASNREIISEYYLAAFAREPSAGESEALEKLMAATPSREQAVQDLVWALISSREFAENH